VEKRAEKIAAAWISQRPGCSPIQAEAFYVSALAAAKAVEQAKKNIKAAADFAKVEDKKSKAKK
jgi:aryl-alcohol dehydrogenase-like predicted oxidoreductase